MNNVVFAGYNKEVGFQSHSGYQIICADRRGEIKFTDKTLTFESGDVIIVPPLTKHCCEGQYLAVILEQALLPVKHAKIITDENRVEITDACRSAVRHFADKNDVVLCAIGQLIAALVTAYSGGNTLPPVVQLVLSDIQKNVSNPAYSLENTIRALPLNYDYVRKLFKKQVGLTPHDYLINERMQLAKKIMTSGASNQYSFYTVAQIAEMCGFSEPLYFSRVFKKYFDISPTDYIQGDKN
jgi:AraC-like DNA-binding protein